MKPEDKAKYLVNEVGKEKALDICETMLDVADEIGLPSNVKFWKKVKQLLKKRKVVMKRKIHKK